MHVIKPGVHYQLQDFNAPDQITNIKFVHRDDEGDFVDGTSNEEVITMLIDRFAHLNKRHPSADNVVCIMLLKNIRSILKNKITRKLKKKR